MESSTVIGAKTRILGSLHSGDCLVIEGAVDGAIDCDDTVTVGAEAQVGGEIRARDVIVFGVLEHNVRATGTIRLHATAQVKANLDAAKVAIDEGAIFDGQITMERRLKPRTEPPAKGTARAIPEFPTLGRAALSMRKLA